MQLNLAYRWFCGLSLEQKVPDHSVFSKNRHGRFAGTGVFRELFYDVVEQAQAAGLVKAKHLSVDASTVDANASMESLEPIVVPMDPAEYLDELEKQAEEVGSEANESKRAEEQKPKRSNATHRSHSDPDARLLKTRYGSSRLCYSHNILMDNSSRMILDVEVSIAG